MFPGDGSQPPPSPLFKLAQRRRSFAEAKVAEPSSEIDGQLFDNLCKTSAPGAPCELPHSRLEPDYRLWCKAPPRVWPTREAEAQEFPSLRFGDRALRLVDFELEARGEETLNACHHSFACSLTAYIDVAIVGVTHETMTALLQFLVQDVKHQIRQQRRERPPLRGPLLRRSDQPIEVSIPRQSRGLYELSRSKRLLGSLARAQYVGRLKAARGYPARFVGYCSFEYVSSPLRGKCRAAFRGFDSVA
jgi:hypothetical protein